MIDWAYLANWYLTLSHTDIWYHDNSLDLDVLNMKYDILHLAE